MPIRSDWRLQREGLTIDTLGRLIKHTLLNPVLTLPLVLLARHTKKGQALASEHPAALKHLKALLGLGLAQRVSGFLDRGVPNNWTNDVYDWSKEIVVVTGGSDGVGKIVVQLLAERGIKVAVLDMQPLTYEAPPSAHYFYADLASAESIATAVAGIHTTLGAPTILVNNASVRFGAPLLAASPQQIDNTFAVNNLAHYHLAQALLPAMVAANHGMLVTVACQAAYVAAPRLTAYAASSAAALAFHEALAAELATVCKAPKVRTVAVFHGYMKTSSSSSKGGFGVTGYTLEPETVAEAIVKAVLAGRSAHIVLPASGWFVNVQLRGWPLWMQYGLRKRFVGLMKGWDGGVMEEEKGEGKWKGKGKGKEGEGEADEEEGVKVEVL